MIRHKKKSAHWDALKVMRFEPEDFDRPEVSDGPVIVVDTREQDPYVFDRQVIRGLKTGDYSIEGMEDLVCIERKSHADAYGSIGRGRDRFRAEFERMADFDLAVLIIEATPLGFWVQPERSLLHPNAANGTIRVWSERYGVRVVYAGDHVNGNAIVEQILTAYHNGRREMSKTLVIEMKDGEEEVKIYAKKKTSAKGTRYFWGAYGGVMITIFNGEHNGEQQLTVLLKAAKPRELAQPTTSEKEDDLPF